MNGDPQLPELGLGPSEPHHVLSLNPEALPKPPILGTLPVPGFAPTGGGGAVPSLAMNMRVLTIQEAADEIAERFKEPSSRTAERLLVVIQEAADISQATSLIAQDFFDKTPAWQVGTDDVLKFWADFAQYTRRLRLYKEELLTLDPSSTATDNVYRGLIVWRSGIGAPWPVPDSVGHMHFVDRLGILEDHSDALGSSFVGGVINALAAAGKKISEGAEDATERIKDSVNKPIASFWERARPWFIAGGILAAAVGGAAVAVAVTRDD